MEVGRRLFPPRIGKRRYWRALETRPYIRGLSNLALTLSRAGRQEEALEAAHRLDRECGRTDTAEARKAIALLNLGRWREAEEATSRVFEDRCGFVAGFALERLGRLEEATERFLRAAIREPRAARMLARVRFREKKVESCEEAEDHNSGVHLLRDLRQYFEAHPPRQGLLRRILETERARAILDEAENVVRRRVSQIRKGHREAFDRMAARCGRRSSPGSGPARSSRSSPALPGPGVEAGGGGDRSMTPGSSGASGAVRGGRSW